INTHRFYYHFDPVRFGDTRLFRSGSTTVLDALNNKSVYVYGRDQRLKHIDKFSNDGNLYSRESLYWAHYKSEQCTYLLSRSLASASGCLAFARTYSYDDRGNVLLDSLYGNLSGHSGITPIITELGAVAENCCERYQKQFKYSDNGFNLLLWECDGIHETSYEYESESNKLIAKFIGEPNKIHLREFYEYNIEAALTKKIIDDGFTKDKNNLAGVTERHITYYSPRTTYPFGYPEVIIEKYLDVASGQEILKNKVVNSHNHLGLLVSQMHYDSTDTYLYTLYWDYNPMGKLIREVDALQNISEWRYDPNGNCIFEQGPDLNVHKDFVYDYANRLIRQDEVHSDGVRKSVSYRYNLLSQPVAISDFHGNETLNEYDAFSRVTHITYPTVLDEDGTPSSPILKKSYDLMGNVTNLIDGKGNVKTMSYTIRGQLAKVTYPDGSSESNFYTMDGQLQSFCSKNGTITSFTYDALGRTVKTEMTSPSGEILSTTSASYNAFHVISETDAMGQQTYYSYYPDGKLKSKRSGDSFSSCTYDAIGRLKASCVHYTPNPEDVIIKTQGYDLLNRVIEERTEGIDGEIFGKVNYTYDFLGRLTETRSGNGSISSAVYDSHGTPIISTDGEGNQTRLKCSFDYVNLFGQQVDCKEVIDALGNATITICDALGRVVSITRKNSLGEVLQKQEMAYDLNGNNCRFTDTIISNASEREVVTKLSYDMLNRLIACCEAADTPEQKLNLINYNIFGQKTSTIKADGTSLNYTYDALGRLSTLYSSDNTIHYAYTYDHNNHPLHVDDLIHKTATIKEYDHSGRITKEILGHGFSLKYDYDAMGRPIHVSLPDGSGFAFKYRAHLEKVQRVSANDVIAYEHVYNSYDLSGHLITATLIGRAGNLNYNYDKNGRLKNAYSSFWEEILAYDAVGNLIEQQLKDAQGYAFTRYSYNDLYQLRTEAGITTHDYQYDSLYNRIQKDNKNHIHNDLNQLLNDGDATYTYDLNGNLLKKVSGNEVINFSYDALDRLVSFADSNQYVRYTYDEANRRLSKEICHKEAAEQSTSKTTTKYIYQGQNEIGSLNAKDEIVELRLLGAGKGAEIGAAVALEIDKKVFAPIHDHAGHVVCIIEASTGENIETYRYSAFGEELFKDSITPWRFSSKRVDAESGFVYFGRRYYDASCGRWISQDPIGRNGGPNLYAYVLNNPLINCDLYGLHNVPVKWKTEGGCANNISITNLATNILKLPGKVIEQAAFHLIPMPLLKDGIGCIGRALSGGNPLNFTPSWNMPQSQLYHHKGNGNAKPNHRQVVMNGICTFFDEFMTSCAKHSSECGGVDVYGIYNATNGLVGDLLEVGGQKLGIHTEAQFCAERDMRELLNSMGEYRNSAILFVKAHSQGCETAYNLSKDVRRVMNVSGYGPARVLSSSDFKNARNYLSPCDFVTYIADPIGLINGIKKGNTSFVKTHGCPLGCHFILGPTYDEVSKSINADYLEKIGR
ncbi:MAG: RHS repeat protein, partial [Parachlamydiaceae bacterium]|nr:RHS repeat protein [Parachlamydiaceae bacterium]